MAWLSVALHARAIQLLYAAHQNAKVFDRSKKGFFQGPFVTHECLLVDPDGNLFRFGLIGFRHVDIEYAIPEGRLNAIPALWFGAGRSCGKMFRPSARPGGTRRRRLAPPPFSRP